VGRPKLWAPPKNRRWTGFFDTEESALVVFVPPALTTAEGYCQGGQYRLAANEADFESPADEPSEP